MFTVTSYRYCSTVFTMFSKQCWKIRNFSKPGHFIVQPGGFASDQDPIFIYIPDRIQIFWNLYNTFYLRKNIKCILKNDLLKGYTLCLKLNRQGSYAASDPRKILSDPDPAKRFPLGRTGCRTFILHNNSFFLPQTERYQIRELFLREYTVHNTQYTVHI